MSKLVVTNVENGKVSYIMGEEVEVSVDDIRNQISVLDREIAALPDINSEIREMEAEAQARISEKYNEVETRKAELTVEYQDFVTEVNRDLEERKSNTIKCDAARAELTRERDKLMAILLNIGEAPIPATPEDFETREELVEESVEEAAAEEETPSEGFYVFSGAEPAEPTAEITAADSVVEPVDTAAEPVEEKAKVKTASPRILF